MLLLEDRLDGDPEQLIQKSTPFSSYQVINPYPNSKQTKWPMRQHSAKSLRAAARRTKLKSNSWHWFPMHPLQSLYSHVSACFFPRLERKNVWIMAAAPHREVCALWHTHHESAAIHPAEFVQTCSNFEWTVVLKITKGYQKHSGIAYQSRSWASAATIWSYARHSVLRVKPWCYGHFHVVTSMQETASCTQAALDPDYFARGSHPDLPSKSICSPCSFATSSSV